MFVSSNLLKELLPYFQRKLKSRYDDREIESFFFFTCFHQFGLAKIEILTGDKRLTESELLFFRDVVERLGKHEPVQYILGKTEFYGLIIDVSPAVLIPRPETEELVDLIVKEHRGHRALRIVDIGTGSGCIAIALQKNLADAEVIVVDVSKEALALAKTNADKNAASVTFFERDILALDLAEIGDLDIVVSNPPYIPLADKATMNRNVLEHEPHVALFVADDDALIFYKRICELAATSLKTGGRLYFEIHFNHGDEVKSLLQNAGFNNVEIRKDLSGLDRFAMATK